MKKKLLTLDDLYNYFSNKNTSSHFSASDEDKNIVVQINGSLKFESSDKDTEGLMPVYLQACHINNNINGSNIKEDVMTNALPSFSNRPILGYIHEVDGQYEFYGHNMHLDNDDNIIYDEIPVGIIPESCDAKLVYDKEKDNTYVEVKGYIFEEYSKAADILTREETCPVSVELSIRELSYDAKNKYLDIEDFFFSGVTILGKNDEGEDVKPGMKGSNIKLSDFSTENNSVFTNLSKNTNKKLIEILEKLDTTLSSLSNFNINNSNAEGKEDKQVDKFEELLAKYNKTKEDVTFKYEGLSDEELEVAFSEAFTEENEELEGEKDPKDNEGSDGEDDPEVKENEACGGSTKKKKKKKCSITEEDGTIREFELSLNDVQSALYNLVNDTYSEADNTWYGVTVYDSYVIMCDWWNDKNYKQTYKREDDNFSLTGDRVEVFANWLTKDEEASLEELRSNYSETKSKLEEYQEKEESEKKDALFISDDYKAIFEKEDFIELSHNHKEFSLEDLKSKLDSMLLSYAKSGNLNFSEISKEDKHNKTTSKVGLPFNTTQKKRRYGSLFSK